MTDARNEPVESGEQSREEKRGRRMREIRYFAVLLFVVFLLSLLGWGAYDYAYVCRIPKGTKVVDQAMVRTHNHNSCFEYFFQSEKYSLWPYLFYRQYVIPDGATEIGHLAFCQRHLRGIRIADSVTVIGEAAFQDCPFLKDVVMPASLTEIGRGAFARCSNLTHLRFPSGVRKIGDYAFLKTGLRELVLPESLEFIGERAFVDCTGLKKIVISPGVKEIGPRAFAGCTALADIELPPGVNVAPNAFEGTLVPPEKIPTQNQPQPETENKP